MSGSVNVHGTLGSGEAILLMLENKIVLSAGATVPSAKSGYKIGALFLQTDGTTLTSLWVNEGTESSCTFRAVFTYTQGAALTAQLTTITHTAPGTPDYAIQNLTTSTPYGFVTADEGNTVLSVIANLQARMAEVEARLESLGLVAAN